MRGKTRQRLTVGQHRHGRKTEEIVIPDPDQGHQQGDVAADVPFTGGLIHLVRPAQQLHNRLETKHEPQRDRTHHGGGGIAPADVILHIKRGQVPAGIVHGSTLAGHRHQMSGRIEPGLGQGGADQTFVGQGLQGGATLGNDVEQGAREIESAQHVGGVIGIDVGDESRRSPRPGVGLQGHGQRPRPQVGAADPHLDHGGERFPPGSGQVA